MVIFLHRHCVIWVIIHPVLVFVILFYEFTKLAEFLVAHAKDSKDHGENNNENTVEEDENTEIKDHLVDHGHDVTQGFEDSEEEEGLDYLLAQEQRHEDLVGDVLGINAVLEDDICDATPGIEDV